MNRTNRAYGAARRTAGARLDALVGAFAVGAVWLCTMAPAEAARFGVRVVDETGEPVVGASVCVGLEGNYRQFGTAFTDVDGRVDMIDVPNVPFVVTVSKTRFAAVRHREPARGFDLVREITLGEGVPGPRCKAGSSIADGPGLVEVRRVDVAGRGAAITLTPDVSGAPSHYRVARDERFADSPWQRFERSIALPGALAEAPSVYLQMRRFDGAPDGWLEARSNVVTVFLPRP